MKKHSIEVETFLKAKGLSKDTPTDVIFFELTKAVAEQNRQLKEENA